MPPRKTGTQKPTSNPLTPAKLAELESNKSASKDILRTQLIYNSWMIDKPTGHKRTVLPQVGNTKRRRVALPRGYRSREYDIVECYAGEDLNAIIYKYYQTLMSTDIREEAVKKDKIRRGRVDKSGSTEMDRWVNGGGFGINYVAGEGIDEKRHEYLGPAPMVAGYQNLHLTDQIRVLWYDAFLQDRWCENESWDIDVEISVNAKGDADWIVTQT